MLMRPHTSDPFTITYDFEAGYVYEIQGIKVSEDKVKVLVVRKGTIKETAPEIAKHKRSPAYWKELAGK